MNAAEKILPEDVNSLQEIVREKSEKLRDVSRQLDFFVLRAKILEEQCNLLRGKLFGKKTQKLVPENDDRQIRLFDESEPVEDLEENADESVEEVVVASHKRKKRGRKPLPADLPRINIVHDIPEEEKTCACGHQLEKIGEEVSEKLDIVPAKIRVQRHIRIKYACKHCEGVESDNGAVTTAPMPPQLIPRGIVTPGLLAHILTSKFVDALPYYRQEKMFSRIGVDLSRQTMASWAILAEKKLHPLRDLLIQELRAGPLIGIDETTVQVMDEPGRKNTTKSYMWVFRGGNPAHPVLLFHYDPSRSAEVARTILGDYKGYVQTDGWASYKSVLGKNGGIVLVNCWAHARSYFVDVVKARKPRKGGAKSGSAEKAISFIAKLYAIESFAEKNELTPEELKELRQEQSKPILDEFFAWLKKRQAQTPPRGLLGKAINYTLNHWKSLAVFLEDGCIRLDNNLVENAIRPFVVGRKNWLFSGSPAGAAASSFYYSLIETAKANGLEPYLYLRYVFEKIPYAKTRDDFRALLPQHIDREALKAFKVKIAA